MKRILIIFLTSVSIWSYGQGQARINVSYAGAPLQNLIEQVEEETPFRFYFLSAWIDTVSVTIEKQNALVEDVLSEVLTGKDLHFFIDGHRVIVTLSVINPRLEEVLSRPSNTSYPLFDRESITEKPSKKENDEQTIGTKVNPGKTTFTIRGYTKDKRSGEPLPGVLVYVKGTSHGVYTDQFGFYSISIPLGRGVVMAELVGMKAISQKVNVLDNGKLDLYLEPSITELKEVVVESNADINVSDVQMGVSRIDVRTMKNIPKVLGENDVFKVATSLPGVKVVGEGASGINVRGGHADQNLVILNEATIYNPSHFLGFFSVFNPDAIRSFELYKSGIPAQYGGRLSSIFELSMRDGNSKQFAGQGGIGPITSHLTLETPVIKEKLAIMAGGRATYSNWVLRALPESVVENTKASFYDWFFRASFNPNEKNTLYLSLYQSSDRFNLSSDTTFAYTNKLSSLQWRHVFKPNVDGIVSITHSAYDYNVNFRQMSPEDFKMGFSIGESNIKVEMNHDYSKHKLSYGFQSKYYQLNPGIIERASDFSLVREREVPFEKGIESALFVADHIDLSQKLSVYLGLRYSFFNPLGARDIFTYYPGRPRTSNTIQDTITFKKNEVISKFGGPEYRLSIRYKVNDKTSVKASYNRTLQYIHMLSNTVSVSPTDTWKLSDPNILPQEADQISAGFYKNLKRDVFEFSTEVYYKKIKNILDFKTGASLLVNEHIDQEVLQGAGKAYGVELLLRKKSGKLTGWLGYSYSRTLIQFDSPNSSERINNGRYFPANYDKPHDFNLISNYKITRRYSFSFNFTYNTGRPITYPIGAYRFGNSYRIQYSERNAFRVPNYIRADLGFNIEGNHKITKLAHSYWSISIYNLFGRKNPYSIYFKVEDEKIKAYRLSIFGAPIPTVSYHFKF